MDRIGTLGDYIQEAMRSWQIPGAAVAVVRGDEVLHMAGYGMRNIETQQPVTPNTRFAIASMTKAFTSMGVALLVDDGKVTWDAPVQEYLPWFRLKDSYASEHISLRDMLSHRSGLPRHDLAWYGTPLTREQLIHNVRYHEPNHTFREVWQYQNLMYVTAGYVTGAVSGTTWEDFIQQRIFNTLGMTASTFTATEMQKSDDYSMPYRVRRVPGEESRVELMPFYQNSVMGPAGSIHSNLTDLVTWLKVHLNEGRFGNTTFVTPGNLAQMHRPNMIRPVDGMAEKLHGTTIAAYGMGWFVEPYRGYTVVHHGGNIDGFSVMISFVPQANVGSIILTNIDGKPLRDSLTYEIYDRVLDLPNGDWNNKYHAIWAEFERGQDQERDTTGTERAADTTPSHPLADYVGEYSADGYADVSVKQEGDQLYGWLAGGWWKLEHYHYDIFELDLDRFELHLKVAFHMDTRGTVYALSLPIESAVADVMFKRKPVTLNADVLNALAGEYDMPFEGMTLSIKIKADGKPFGQMTGQSEFELLPYRVSGNDTVEFMVKGISNLSLVFSSENDQYIALIKQFNNVYRAPRIVQAAH
jgi:CubicO group peptidase (beta-lactamase class C family)